MFSAQGLIWWLFLLGLVVAVWALLLRAGRPPSRASVEAFARRQALVLTEANAPLVVASLTITHRWRRFGLVTGVALGFMWALPQGRVELNFVAMLLGWFAGAVVAEWRVSAPERGTRRRADLAPRTLASYVTATNRASLGVVLGLLALAMARSGMLAVARPALWSSWLIATAECVVGGLVLWAVARRVVGRARPSEPDLRNADDALRSNSLTALSGSAVALAAVPAASYVQILVATDPHYNAIDLATVASGAAVVVMTLVLAALGYWMAVWSPSLRALQRVSV